MGMAYFAGSLPFLSTYLGRVDIGRASAARTVQFEQLVFVLLMSFGGGQLPIALHGSMLACQHRLFCGCQPGHATVSTPVAPQLSVRDSTIASLRFFSRH